LLVPIRFASVERATLIDHALNRDSSLVAVFGHLIKRDHELDGFNDAFDLQGCWKKGFRNEDSLSVRVRENVLDLISRLSCVDRPVDGSRCETGEVCDCPLRPVLGPDCDTLPATNAHGDQPERQLTNAPGDVSVSERIPGAVALEPEELRVAVSLDCGVEQFV